MVEEDWSFVRRVQAGDIEAFGPLYERYQKRVAGFIRRRFGEDAEDLTANVFEKALEALPRYLPQAPFSSWLYRIAHNEGANSLRSRYRNPTLPLVETEDFIANDADPEASYLEKEEKLSIWSAVGSLPLRQQIAVLGHVVEGLNFKEVAGLLQTTEGNAKILAFRGYQALRRKLYDY